MCAGDKSTFTFVDSRFAIALIGKNCQIVVFLNSPLHPTIWGAGGGVRGALASEGEEQGRWWPNGL